MADLIVCHGLVEENNPFKDSHFYSTKLKFGKYKAQTTNFLLNNDCWYSISYLCVKFDAAYQFVFSEEAFLTLKLNLEWIKKFSATERFLAMVDLYGKDLTKHEIQEIKNKRRGLSGSDILDISTPILDNGLCEISTRHRSLVKQFVKKWPTSIDYLINKLNTEAREEQDRKLNLFVEQCRMEKKDEIWYC